MGETMPKSTKRAVCCAIFVIVLLTASILEAQQPTNPPPAPVPSQIITARKAFISNASGESNLPPGTADLNYNQFYASMKSWGRYELVSAPADADLVFELHYEILFEPVLVSNGQGGSGQSHQIRLSILDPKSHVILWAFTEPVVQVQKKATGLQNFQQAMDKLMGDVKTLAARPAPEALAPND
jgi:hypothetical protein